MKSPLSTTSSGGRFARLIDQLGNTPCDPPDDCAVCALFGQQRSGESRARWLARITGINLNAHQEAS